MQNFSVMQTFEEYIKMFNHAIENESYDDAIRLGKKVVEIADRECLRPDITPAIKKIYTENSQLAREYVTDLRLNVGSRTSHESDTTISKKSWFNTDESNLTLRDVKGLQDVKDEFIVNVLAPNSPKYSPVYEKFRGSHFDTQILLYGPPGTGKTFLVKCLAGTLKCPVAIVHTKDILAKYVGDAEFNMSEVFEEARKLDKCIVFFDELDALAASRDDEESRHTKGALTTLLTSMDGFTKSAKPGQQLIVIAATNRPWILDSAVKRGGRFETQIYVPTPDFDARYQLIKLALGKDSQVVNRIDVPCATDVSIEWLADMFEGMSGADIKAVCKQIINRPLHREIKLLQNGGESIEEVITQDDCTFVRDRYINSITDEMLCQFDAYKENLELSEYMHLMSSKMKDNKHKLPDYFWRYAESTSKS